ncbi:MAG TPA: ChaN family lipoprotein [Thermoanaerobaculia bacterium]|nr:ChaN family lipoprotein [Thermoanaerobaculia bacterium]
MRHAFALFLLLAFPLAAEDPSLHLAIGDPARKDREAPVVLDGITDAGTGEVLAPSELAPRLSGVRLLLVGESHTDADFHQVQLRVIEELHRAGRPVLIGLEMFPYTEQRYLDQWIDGLLTEEGFVRLSRWYKSWGYNWGYYRDIFLFARDRGIRMFAVNAPREAITAVRQKGFDALSPEEAAHLPRQMDTTSQEHRTLIRSFFGGDDPLHGGMSPEQFEAMYTAQSTWDATMGHNAVKALREHGAPGSVMPGSVMVLLAGSGHVAYGLGIQRQVATGFEKEFGGRIAALIPVPVRDDDGDPVDKVQASYADFVWGVPPESDPVWPGLGLSTGMGEGEAARKVLFVTKGSAADKAGFQTGDLLLTFDGTPVMDKEVFNRLLAGKRWGDTAVFTVKRGEETRTLTVSFRRHST